MQMYNKNIPGFISKSRLIALLGIIAIVLSSCRISLISDYDDRIAQQIELAAKKVDKFYLTMLETTTQDDKNREYSNFIDEYIDIEVELNALLNRNKVKSLNKNSIRICEITLELWVKYKEEHKKDVQLSDTKIRLNRKNMGELFYAMLAAEEGKKVIDNTQN
jgi:hypothetical protein